MPFVHSGPDWEELNGTAQLNNSITVKSGNLDIALVDQDRNNATIAVTQVPVDGQWPLHFSLMYDANGIESSHHYVMQSQLEQNGKTTYQSTSPTPVLTHGGQNENIQLTLAPKATH